MGIYEALEERYYSFLDWLDEHGIPLWKLAQPIEAKGIPSFPIFAGIALAILAGVGWGIYALFFGPKVYVVTVLDPSGNPIAGAVVSVGGETYRTGPDGTVELELKGDEQIIIMATGYEDTLVTAEELSEPVVLKPLVRKATVFVVDTDGRPVSATVKVFGKNGEREFQGSRIEFNVARVETDDAVVMGSILRVEVTADGYEKTVTTITWDAPAKTVRLRKEKPPSATLYIFTDPPVNGWIYLMSGLTTVDRTLLKSGKATFYGVQYGYYTFRVVPVVDGKKYEDPEGRNTFDVEVREPSVQKYVEIYVPDVNEVETSRVHILDANTLEPLRATVFVVETNATYRVDGLFEIQMERGTTFTLNISARKHYDRTVKLEAGDDVNVFLERAPAVGSIVVEVQDVHNHPVPGVSVILLDLNDNVIAEANAPTDDEGMTYFSDILVGQYVAEACMGSVCARSKPFEVEEDEITHAPVLLAPGYGSVSITLTVDGVPSSGKIKLVRIPTGETIKEGDIGLDGRGELDEVPAYIRMRAEVSTLGMTYVSPAFFLLPHETRHMDVELQSEGEPSFQILGVYVGGARVGVVEGGKRYTLKISFLCEGDCSENFSIENGLFLDTDWPGRYAIGDANGTAEAGHELNVSLTCDGKCMGTFDVDINVDVASFGEKLVIKHGENIFSVPIAYEGTCSGDLCAFAVFARKGEHISPFDLYEELKYDMNLGIVWGGKTIENAIFRIVPSGPADIEINGQTEYEIRGRLKSGAYISLSGAAYSPDPGTETLDIVVSTCDPAYVNCTDVGSLTLSAHFATEPDGEVTIVPDPDFFVGCPFTLTLSLIDENGQPVVFNSETMVFKAFGVAEEGVKTPLSYSWESDRITVSFNGADYDSVEVHFDGFGYAEAVARVFRSDPQLEPETYPEGEDVDVGDTLTFVFRNSSELELNVDKVIPHLSGLRVTYPRSRSSVEPNGDLIINISVDAVSEYAVGAQQTGTLEIKYSPILKGVGECNFTTVAPATYTPLPSCLKVSARQIENSQNIEVNIQNKCQKICPHTVTVTASSKVGAYTCEDVVGDGTCAVPRSSSEVITCMLNSGNLPDHSTEFTVTVNVMALYGKDNTPEHKTAHTRVLYLPEVCRGSVIFEEEINAYPPFCTSFGEDNGVNVGLLRPPASCGVPLVGFDININGTVYSTRSDTPTARTQSEQTPISTDTSVLLLSKLRIPNGEDPGFFWYDPFSTHDRLEDVPVSVVGYYEKASGETVAYEINAADIDLNKLPIECHQDEDEDTLDVNACGPIYVGIVVADNIYGVEVPPGRHDLDWIASAATSQIPSLSTLVENVCDGKATVDNKLKLIKSNGWEDIGSCTAAKAFALLEAHEVNIEDAYPVTTDPGNTECIETTPTGAQEECVVATFGKTPADQDKYYLNIVALREDQGQYEVNFEPGFDNYTWYTCNYDPDNQKCNWTNGSPDPLSGDGYELLAQLVLRGPTLKDPNTKEHINSCSTDLEDKDLNVPIDVLIDNDGCHALGIQNVTGASNARVWGYGLVTPDCATILKDSGFTVWEYATDFLDSKLAVGIAFEMQENARTEGDGFISRDTLQNLGLKEGIHYSLAENVRDVNITVTRPSGGQNGEINCNNGKAELYGIFWDVSGRSCNPNTSTCDALLLCLPADGVYDGNFFNNATYVENFSSMDYTININAQSPCTCTVTACDGVVWKLGPGETNFCETCGTTFCTYCYYRCTDSCEMVGGCGKVPLRTPK